MSSTQISGAGLATLRLPDVRSDSRTELRGRAIILGQYVYDCVCIYIYIRLLCVYIYIYIHMQTCIIYIYIIYYIYIYICVCVRAHTHVYYIQWYIQILWYYCANMVNFRRTLRHSRVYTMRGGIHCWTLKPRLLNWQDERRMKAGQLWHHGHIS